MGMGLGSTHFPSSKGRRPVAEALHTWGPEGLLLLLSYDQYHCQGSLPPHRWSSTKQGFSNLSLHQNNTEGLLKHGFLDPIARVSDSVVLGWGPGFAFLSSTQVKLMLLFRGPHLENHCSRPCTVLAPPPSALPLFLQIKEGFLKP